VRWFLFRSRRAIGLHVVMYSVPFVYKLCLDGGVLFIDRLHMRNGSVQRYLSGFLYFCSVRPHRKRKCPVVVFYFVRSRLIDCTLETEMSCGYMLALCTPVASVHIGNGNVLRSYVGSLYFCSLRAHWKRKCPVVISWFSVSLFRPCKHWSRKCPVVMCWFSVLLFHS